MSGFQAEQWQFLSRLDFEVMDVTVGVIYEAGLSHQAPAGSPQPIFAWLGVGPPLVAAATAAKSISSHEKAIDALVCSAAATASSVATIASSPLTTWWLSTLSTAAPKAGLEM